MAIPDGLDGKNLAITFAFSRDLERGTWRPVKLPYALTATVTCPDCGKTWILLDHVVKYTGEVYPSVMCQCGFRNHIELKGWAEHSAYPENITA